MIITQEEASPRFIDLSWFEPTFGTPASYNIYRTVVGTPFSTTPLASVPGTQTNFKDTVSCNAAGYQYRVTAVTNNDAGAPQESTPSNTVPATGEPLLTGCYTVTFSPFPVAAQGSDVSISFTLLDDFFVTPGDTWAHAAPNGVSKLSSGKLFVDGPVANGGNCTTTPPTGQTLIGTITNGVAVAAEAGDTLTSGGDVYTFTWSGVNTDNFCAGSYIFELDLDSGQHVKSLNALQLGIDVNDVDGPRITNAPLTAGTVGVLYTNTFIQDGGVGTITWSISQGSLPNGISLNPATGVVSGYATSACTCTFTVQAKDSNGNIGTQAFTLVMHIWVSASPAPASAPPSFVANPMLPPMTVGIQTADSTYQSGAVPGAVTWSLAPGSNPLPNGTTISNNGLNTTGVLSGYPTTACTCQFTLVARDSAGNTGTLTFTLVVHIFVSASQPPPAILANFPFVPNPALPAMTVGVANQDTLYQSGATGSVTWTFTGSLPPGISQQGSGATISGTTCAAGPYNTLSASAADSATPNNTGSQVLTLQVNKGTSATGVTSNVQKSAFQQMVTFTVTVAPQFSCTPTGTVTLMDGGSAIASDLALTGGAATFATSALSVGTHSITASYSGDTNFNSTNSGIWSQTVSSGGLTNTVTSLADDGSAGTLRSVIANSNSGSTIDFNLTGTIVLTLGQLEINKNLTISGPGAAGLAISGNNVTGVFVVDSGITVTISGVTIKDGKLNVGNGGCCGGGGGINNSGTLTLIDAAVSNNSAGYAGYGGGIYNVYPATLTLIRTTMSGNSAENYGGAIYDENQTVAINSTFSGNSAHLGGVAWNVNGITLTNSTLSGNSAGSGGTLFFGGRVAVKNTILATTSGGNCNGGSWVSYGHNLSDDASCSSLLTATGDLNNTPAGLDPAGLKNNGGPTQTIALVSGSPAIDAIPVSPTNYCTTPDGTTPIDADQRGITRPQGAACDIGAFEVVE